MTAWDFIVWRSRGVKRFMSNVFYLTLSGRSALPAITCDMDFSKLDRTVILNHPIGVVIARPELIGPGCDIRQNVTIGRRAGRDRDGHSYPVLGCNVFVGAGAVIVGGISIGDNAKIGANSVILADVPAGCTAVGLWK